MEIMIESITQLIDKTRKKYINIAKDDKILFVLFDNQFSQAYELIDTTIKNDIKFMVEHTSNKFFESEYNEFNHMG